MAAVPVPEFEFLNFPSSTLHHMYVLVYLTNLSVLRGQGTPGRFTTTFHNGPTHQDPSEKSTLKGKNLLPRGANSYLLG